MNVMYSLLVRAILFWGSELFAGDITFTAFLAGGRICPSTKKLNPALGGFPRLVSNLWGQTENN